MLTFDTYYHVYNHANGDDNLFREEKNYDFFLQKYKKHIHPVAKTIAWCLMPNHFHLLIKIRNEQEILSLNKNFQHPTGFENLSGVEEKEKAASNFFSQQFSNLFNSYAKAFNKSYNRRGSLFMRPFKSKVIVDDNNLRNVILYIHLNPIKHGFTDEINDWKYTSYPYFQEMHPKLLKELFDDEVNYEYLHQTRKETFKEYLQMEEELT